MKLIVTDDYRILSKENNFRDFICHALGLLCKLNPNDHFIFLSCGNGISQNSNIESVSMQVPALMKPFAKVWYQRKINSQIIKHRADIVISLSGIPTLAAVRQLMVITEDTGPKTVKDAIRYCRDNTGCGVITSSRLMKQKLVKQGFEASAVFVLRQSPGILFQPLSWEKREEVKNKNTGGREFFMMLVSGLTRNRIVDALKAFSQFKKWQQSNMQLVLSVNPEDKNEISELLQSYKYRNELLLLDEKTDAAEYASIMASAMAMIYIPADEGKAVMLKNAMQCGIPVITSATDTLKEAAGDCVVFCDTLDVQRLSGEMLRLYKEEKFRNSLTEKARAHVSMFSEERTIQRLWDYIRQSDTA